MRSPVIFLFLLFLHVCSSKFTTDFSTFLKAQNSKYVLFEREDLGFNAYGGKQKKKDRVQKQPVIFIHGSTDVAYGDPSDVWYTGWTKVIEYFEGQGYTSAELYAITWGTPDLESWFEFDHDMETIKQIRHFIKLVLKYTKQKKVDIIAHSTGVTLARAAVKGVEMEFGGEFFHIGPSLSRYVDSFIGIAGLNLGAKICASEENLHTLACSKQNGFFPGNLETHEGLSKVLEGLNKDPTREGHFVASIYSMQDTVAEKFGTRHTSSIPGEDKSIVLDSFIYNHVSTKDFTAEMQYKLVTDHQYEDSKKSEL